MHKVQYAGSPTTGISSSLRRAAELARLSEDDARCEADQLFLWFSRAVSGLLNQKGHLAVAVRSAHGGRPKIFSISGNLADLDMDTRRAYSDKLYESVVFVLTLGQDKS